MELAVIAVIALLVLGPSRLPDAARSLGKGMREMRNSFQGLTDGDEDRDRHLEEDNEDPADDAEFPADAAGDEDGVAAPAASPGRS